MNKVIVIGCPGSGKSEFSRKLKDITNNPLFHLDMIYHNSDGTHISKEELEDKLKEIFKNKSWIIDGNYQKTIEMRIKECDSIFLLDLPTEVCIQGATERIGTQRQDLPFVEEKLDENFKKTILNFKAEKLPRIYELLEKYGKDKSITVFKSRNDIDNYIKLLCKLNNK